MQKDEFKPRRGKRDVDSLPILERYKTMLNMYTVCDLIRRLWAQKPLRAVDNSLWSQSEIYGAKIKALCCTGNIGKLDLYKTSWNYITSSFENVDLTHSYVAFTK